VIERRFGLGGEPRTLAEIADDLQLSTGRVRAIESDAMHDLALELEDEIAV
jgi:DNA-directed RNA polymerase sigma subunit (sigma70/sigma32)